jgi:lysozyme
MPAMRTSLQHGLGFGLCVVLVVLAACTKPSPPLVREEVVDPAASFDGVIDLGWDEGPVNFPSLRDRDGIACVVHRATRSVNLARVDKDYVIRERAARDAGMGWGAYHFGDGLTDPEVQADALMTFVRNTALANGTAKHPLLLVLDNEGRNRMTLKDVALFARRVARVTGRFPGLYSNGREIGEKDPGQLADDPVTTSTVGACWLWLADYNPGSPKRLKFPVAWTRWTLWQYTGDSDGTVASALLSIGRNGEVSESSYRRSEVRKLPDGKPTRRSVDRNLFNGTRAQWTEFYATNATRVSEWTWPPPPLR